MHPGAFLRTVLEIAVGAQGAAVEGALESAAATTAANPPRPVFVDTYGAYGGNFGNVRGASGRIEPPPFLSSVQEGSSGKIAPPPFFPSSRAEEPGTFFASAQSAHTETPSFHPVPASIDLTAQTRGTGEPPRQKAAPEIALRRENAELRQELQVLLGSRNIAQPGEWPSGPEGEDAETADDDKVHVKVSDDSFINLSHFQIMLVLILPFVCLLLVLFARMPVAAEQAAEEADGERRGARPREHAEKVMEAMRNWIGVFWPVAVLGVFGILEIMILRASGALDNFLKQMLPIVAAGFFALAGITALMFVLFEQVNAVQRDMNEKVHMVEELFLGTAQKVGDVGNQFKDATVQGVVRAKDGTIQGVQYVGSTAVQGGAEGFRRVQEGSAETLRVVQESPVGTAFKQPAEQGCVVA